LAGKFQCWLTASPSFSNFYQAMLKRCDALIQCCLGLNLSGWILAGYRDIANWNFLRFLNYGSSTQKIQLKFLNNDSAIGIGLSNFYSLALNYIWAAYEFLSKRLSDVVWQQNSLPVNIEISQLKWPIGLTFCHPMIDQSTNQSAALLTILILRSCHPKNLYLMEWCGWTDQHMKITECRIWYSQINWENIYRKELINWKAGATESPNLDWDNPVGIGEDWL
jgi:hypothetical protein